MTPRARFRIKKVGRRSIWFDTGFRWRMICRACGRRAHHDTWEDAMRHASLHDCTPGSLW